MALALTACGGGDSGSGIGNAVKGGAAPAADAGQLQAKLTSTAFGGTLPPNYTTPVAFLPASPDGDEQKAGEIAAVTAMPKATHDDIGNILYRIFKDEAAARAYVEKVKPPYTAGSFAPAGVPAPAACHTGNIAANTAGEGRTECITAAGNVAVSGITLARSAKDHGNNDDALALMKAGLAQLEAARK